MGFQAREVTGNSRRIVFQTKQRDILSSPDADPVHSVQFPGQQHGTVAEALTIGQSNCGKLCVLS